MSSRASAVGRATLIAGFVLVGGGVALILTSAFAPPWFTGTAYPQIARAGGALLGVGVALIVVGRVGDRTRGRALIVTALWGVVVVCAVGVFFDSGFGGIDPGFAARSPDAVPWLGWTLVTLNVFAPAAAWGGSVLAVTSLVSLSLLVAVRRLAGRRSTA